MNGLKQKNPQEGKQQRSTRKEVCHAQVNQQLLSSDEKGRTNADRRIGNISILYHSVGDLTPPHCRKITNVVGKFVSKSHSLHVLLKSALTFCGYGLQDKWMSDHILSLRVTCPSL